MFVGDSVVTDCITNIEDTYILMAITVFWVI